MVQDPQFYEPPLPGEIDERDPEEVQRQHIAAKRVFFLLVGIAVFLLGVLVFEMVELGMGGAL